MPADSGVNCSRKAMPDISSEELRAAMLSPPPPGIPLLIFGLVFLIRAFARHCRLSLALGGILVVAGLLMA
jgi:hypothetical protein